MRKKEERVKMQEEVEKKRERLFVTLAEASRMSGISPAYLGHLMRKNLIDVGKVIKEEGYTKRRYLINVEKLKNL